MNQTITKKQAIKKMIILIISIIVLSGLFMFLTYGKIPVGALLIAFAIMLPIMIVSAIMGFKHREKINEKVNSKKNLAANIYLVLGILLIITHGLVILINESEITNYIQLGVGLILVAYGIRLRIKNKNTE